MSGVFTIISGGQTGVDRAALEVGQKLGIRIGGWCPKGRRAEDGEIDSRYPLRETPDRRYRVRTEWNVRDADGTLIISREPLSALTGGTRLTWALGGRRRKPRLFVDPRDERALNKIVAWIRENNLRTLNVAGPRESQAPGIYQQAHHLLHRALSEIIRAEGENG